MITIVDYGSGNLGSIVNMLKRAGFVAKLASSPDQVKSATKLILPGVGSFDFAMKQLKEKDLLGVLNDKALVEKVPVLGLCLGVQLFTNRSEEGQEQGLGWFDAEVVRFKLQDFPGLKVPNMGWCDVLQNKTHLLFDDMHKDPRFYFVHSYHLKAHHAEDVLCTARYGYDYPAGLSRDNISGVQFHPEKSHKYGLKLLSNFCKSL